MSGQPVCPCCGNNWISTRGWTMLGDCFVCPAGWYQLSQRQAKIIRPLTLGPQPMRYLMAQAVYTREATFRSAQGTINQYLRTLGFGLKQADMGNYDMVRL